MPYTLTKGLLWFLLALVLGIVIGWLLRSVRATFQIRAARRAAIASVTGVPESRDAPAADGSDASPDTPADVLVPAVETVSIAPSARSAAEVAPEPAAATVEHPAADPTDLTAIEGIDVTVAERCRAIGIASWADLAATEVSLLRTMLADAGPDYADRDPSTWPEQAAALVSASTGSAPSST